MFQLTCNLGLHEYKRDTCEVLLCEGTPGRYLKKKDVFLPDGIIFYLNVDGKKMKNILEEKTVGSISIAYHI